VPCVRGEAELEVGVDGVPPAVLQLVGLELRDQADPPTFVPAEVDDDSSSLLHDAREGLVELRPAVAAA
jgi:hypothetical protein